MAKKSTEQKTPQEIEAERVANEAEESAALNAGFNAAQGLPSPEADSTKTPKQKAADADDEDGEQAYTDDADDKGSATDGGKGTGKDKSGDSDDEDADGDDDDDSEDDDDADDDAGDGKAKNPDDEPITLTKGELKKITDGLASLTAMQSTLQNLGDPGKALDERERKIMSKIGELNRTIETLNKGGKRKIDKDAFKRLGAEYQQVAALLAEDLSEILDSPASPGIDKEQLIKDVEEISKKNQGELLKELQPIIDQRVQNTVLDILSPGWETTLKSDEFGEYLDSLPTKERKAIEAETNPQGVVAAINQFKGWQTAQEQAAEQRRQEKKDKKDRLKKGEQPKGSGGAGNQGGKKDDEEDEQAAMNSGFNKVYGNQRR